MRRYRIAYLAAFLIAAVAFVGTNSAAALLAVVALAVLFAANMLLGFLSGKTELGFGVRPLCEVGQPLVLSIEAFRPVPLPTGRIELTFSCRNCMLGEERPLAAVLEATAKRRARFELPLDTASCGHVELSLQDAFSYDPLGLVKRRLSGTFSGSCTVYPRMADLVATLGRSPQASFFGSMYDLRRRGRDQSEVFDIRDYRESDSLRTIHWKLSSKVDRLVVREASHPSSYDILLLLDRGAYDRDGFRTQDALTTALLELASSVSLALCRQNLGHTVAFLSDDRMASSPVDSPASFEDALDALLGMPMPKAPGIDAKLFLQYRREQSFTKVVLVTSLIDQQTFSLIGKLADLSVLYLAPETGQTLEEQGEYTITSIPLSTLGERVRNVAI